MDREEYAVDIQHAQEILRSPELTRIPRMPASICGVMNLRGKIIPVMDLRKKLGMSPAEGFSDDSRVLVLNYSGRIVGLVVDAMSQVLRLEKTSIHPVPAVSGTPSPTEFIHGVIRLDDRLLIVLDLENLLSE